ncbi:PREDICTED: B9 domain-containing protein 1 [Drosophila arizonae]|uniref:B9 domain-containing protein 1 n=1 Tax=Drosophila arizonae TaxID=7263 RepID=A0ABM1PRE8_DROAR|nr:PREDICTED: B9 domain-containing protein 1 [Drosophila arizonae]
MYEDEETGNQGNEDDKDTNKVSPKQKQKKSKRPTNAQTPNELGAKSTASFFTLFITGQIVSATFPLGPDKDYIFCRYELVAGPDWQLVSGPQYGITQMSTNKTGHFNDKIVFNMPIEVTYKSTSPFGWPQILVSVFGQNQTGNESLVGYAHVYMPIFGGHQQVDEHISSLNQAPILRPKCPNMLGDITSWLLRRQPELKNPKILLDSAQSKGLSMESYGTLEFQLHAVMRGARKLGYNWHA